TSSRGNVRTPAQPASSTSAGGRLHGPSPRPSQDHPHTSTRPSAPTHACGAYTSSPRSNGAAASTTNRRTSPVRSSPPVYVVTPRRSGPSPRSNHDTSSTHVPPTSTSCGHSHTCPGASRPTGTSPAASSVPSSRQSSRSATSYTSTA